MGIVDLPQTVWGYIFLASAFALVIALRATDPRRKRSHDRGRPPHNPR
jgi:hypothetical protein